jgi:hypothetical protein
VREILDACVAERKHVLLVLVCVPIYGHFWKGCAGMTAGYHAACAITQTVSHLASYSKSFLISRDLAEVDDSFTVQGRSCSNASPGTVGKNACPPFWQPEKFESWFERVYQ